MTARRARRSLTHRTRLPGLPPTAEGYGFGRPDRSGGNHAVTRTLKPARETRRCALSTAGFLFNRGSVMTRIVVPFAPDRPNTTESCGRS
jgi:hypothetical protein